MDTQQLSQVSATKLSGIIDDLDEAYGRNVATPWFILIPILVFSAIGILPIVLFNTIRGKGSSVNYGDGRSIKDLRKGPEIPITPLWIREEDGHVTEIELHGYIRADRLLRNDRVELVARQQHDKAKPRRAHTIVNHTTEQTITPHPSTTFWHLGIPMILQATVGFALLALIIFGMIST